VQRSFVLLHGEAHQKDIGWLATLRGLMKDNQAQEDQTSILLDSMMFQECFYPLEALMFLQICY
jgi:hypothetical protein